MKFLTVQKTLLSLFFITLLSIPAWGYTFNGFEIKDLESGTTTGFANEAKVWTSSKLVGSQITSDCDGKPWLGGYNVLGVPTTGAGAYFQRTYKTLPQHNVLFFTATLSVLDNWVVGSDAIKLLFDGAQLDRLQFSQADFPSNKCGATGSNDLTDVYVVGRIPHFFSTLTLRIVFDSSKLTTQASFGIRDISILFTNVNSNGLITEACTRSSATLSVNQCPCPKGQYTVDGKFSLDSTAVGSTCSPCNANCASCFGAATSECYECAFGTYYNGVSCVDCYPTCDACTGPGPSKCKSI